MARAQAIGAEAGLEDALHRGHERGASGQEHAVHVGGRDARGLQKPVDTTFDATFCTAVKSAKWSTQLTTVITTKHSTFHAAF